MPEFYEHRIMPVTDLIPYANNARTHSDAQVAKLAGAIREFGFTNPVLVDDDGGIVAGHGRIMAAQKLGMETVPCIVVSGLDEIKRKALILADNRLAMDAEWNEELLMLELKALGDQVHLSGFDEDELIKLLQPEAVEGLTDEDAVPEVTENPVTVEGDVWVLGNHRLMCGDSTSLDAVDKLMAGAKADMVFTDPPYGVEYQSNWRTKSAKFDVLANDDVLLDISPIIEAFSDGWVFVWTSWKVQTKWIDIFAGFGYPTNMVIWYKPGGGIGDLKKTFYSDYEVALVWHRGAELCGKRIGSVWKVSKDGATTYVHPTQKPVELSREAFDKTTRAGAKVLDLFGGSGSTLIGAEQTGRNAYLMELDPKYCDLIIKRWQDYTGKQAIHENTGKTYAELSSDAEAA